MSTFDPSVLRRPRWILAVVVALSLAALFVRLGMWQLSRLEERRTANAVIEAKRVEPPRPIEGLVGQYGMDPEALKDRQAIVTGTYRVDDEFFSIGRTYDTLTGTMVLTPLLLADGSTMIVTRGLVPPDTAGPPASGFEPPLGVVTVSGYLDDGEEPLRIGEPDPPGGVLRSISRVDLAYVDAWLDGEVLPVSLIRTAQDPGDPDAMPAPIPLEELTEGPHLGYAVQWFGFALVAVVGLAYLIWRAGTEVPPSGDVPDRTMRG